MKIHVHLFFGKGNNENNSMHTDLVPGTQ